MELTAILAWVLSHELAIVSIALFVSELLGAIPLFKANGIVSFVLLQVQGFLKKRGAIDLTVDE
jgi:hypothetical protein